MNSRADQIFKRFVNFHVANLQIWELFESFSLMLVKRNFRHYSSDAVVQRIRWHVDVETVGSQFKINDHYRAYYARMFEAAHPEYGKFFRNRVLVSREQEPYAQDIEAMGIKEPRNESELMAALKSLADATSLI